MTRNGTDKAASSGDLHRHRGTGRGYRVVGLFAGIGGLELGLSRAGHETTLLCEIDPYAQSVLREKFPGIDIWPDVRKLNALPSGTEVLAAGFPCQDLSQAGKGAGIDGERSGLIDHVFRLVKSSDIEWLVLENVPFMLHLRGGEAMATIARRLKRLGFRWAYRLVDTRAFGLPQRRERIFLLASRTRDPAAVLFADDAAEPGTENLDSARACGFYWTEGNRGLGWAWDAVPPLKGGTTLGSPTPPAIILPQGGIVMPNIRDAERLQGFPADWTACVPKERRRWRLIGNAVSVPVARWIGKRLAAPGRYDEARTMSFPDSGWPKAALDIGVGPSRICVSSWPVRRRSTPLAEFLRYPARPLSERATNGFYERVTGSYLRLPPWFLERVAQHLEAMRSRAP
jgi:DNA (cytosine-5)-methyltransferase 1